MVGIGANNMYGFVIIINLWNFSSGITGCRHRFETLKK